MKRIFLLTLATAVAGFATSVNAATLTITPDSTSYSPSQAITLTIVGTINATAELTPNIDVRIAFTNSTFVSSTSETALNPPPMFGPQTNWTVGGTQDQVIGGEVTAMNQIQGLPPGGPFVNNCNGSFTVCTLTATVVLTAGSPGTAEFDFGALTNFFGVGGGAGTTVTIIPEPGTAALMGLGLLGLIVAGRRR